MPQVELLCPAGDLERLKFAVLYGADAVYAAGESFGMRSAPKNFTPQALAEGAAFAHARGKKLYVTLNTVPTNEELSALPAFLQQAQAAGADAFIVADWGVLRCIRQCTPQMPVHVSTQAGVANWGAACFAHELGAKRVVLARELSIKEIEAIRRNTPPELELEVFVHGAVCMSFSGRCLLSNYFTARDANRGACTQPCRWKWQTVDAPSAQELAARGAKFAARCFDVAEDEDGSYILNANDLCAAPLLGELVQAGVTSLKIEGRAKTFYYAASTAAAYRRALDGACAPRRSMSARPRCCASWERRRTAPIPPAFLQGGPAAQDVVFGGYEKAYEVAAVVQGWQSGVLTCQQRGKFCAGHPLEALTPQGDALCFTPAWLEDGEGARIEAAPHPPNDRACAVRNAPAGVHHPAKEGIGAAGGSVHICAAAEGAWAADKKEAWICRKNMCFAGYFAGFRFFHGCLGRPGARRRAGQRRAAGPLILNIYAGWKMARCRGCFGCWLKTPGECVLRDGSERIGPALMSGDRVYILSRSCYGGFFR